VNPAQWAKFQALCADWDVEATRIGTFTNSERLIVRYSGNTVADLSLAFMKDGLPRLRLRAVVPPIPENAPQSKPITDLNAELLRVLSDPNVASKEDIIRRYDHEVRGGTIVKPIIGDGPSDAVVIKPLETPEHNMGFALGVGLFVDRGLGSSYKAGWGGVCEAINNVVAVGADPDRIAILDNFCWGDPKNPEQLGRLVQIAQETTESAEFHHAPFVSGKDSLNNVYIGHDSQRHNIPGTLVISAIGIIPDVTKAITVALKRPKHKLYLFPAVSWEEYQVLHTAMERGLIAACHDVSDGGIAGAIAEMCIAGQLGAHIIREKIENEILDLAHPMRNIQHVHRLFEPIVDRFILEVTDNTKFKRVFRRYVVGGIYHLGEVTAEQRYTLTLSENQPPVIDLPISELTAAYKRQGKYAT
jgi:phosphoribosylformylglycinamidine synthase